MERQSRRAQFGMAFPPPVSHRGFEILILSQLHRFGLAGASKFPLKVPLGLTATYWEPGVQARSTLTASNTFRELPDDARGKDRQSGQPAWASWRRLGPGCPGVGPRASRPGRLHPRGPPTVIQSPGLRAPRSPARAPPLRPPRILPDLAAKWQLKLPTCLQQV